MVVVVEVKVKLLLKVICEIIQFHRIFNNLDYLAITTLQKAGIEMKTWIDYLFLTYLCGHQLAQ